jgi:hypothetical protein
VPEAKKHRHDPLDFNSDVPTSQNIGDGDEEIDRLKRKEVAPVDVIGCSRYFPLTSTFVLLKSHALIAKARFVFRAYQDSLGDKKANAVMPKPRCQEQSHRLKKNNEENYRCGGVGKNVMGSPPRRCVAIVEQSEVQAEGHVLVNKHWATNQAVGKRLRHLWLHFQVNRQQKRK